MATFTNATSFQQENTKTSSNKFLNIVVHAWPKFRMNQKTALDNYIDSTCIGSKWPEFLHARHHHGHLQEELPQHDRRKNEHVSTNFSVPG